MSYNPLQNAPKIAWNTNKIRESSLVNLTNTYLTSSVDDSVFTHGNVVSSQVHECVFEANRGL